MNNRSGLLDAETDALDCPVLQKRRSPPPHTLVSIINSSTGHRVLKFEEVKERKAVVVVMVVYNVDAGEERGECVCVCVCVYVCPCAFQMIPFIPY